MKKFYTLFLALLLSGLTPTFAQLGNGWDSAFNFGGAGNSVTEMRYDASGNLYFIATVMGKNLFAGTQIDPGGFGSFPTTETIYGKIAPDGTQTLLKRIKSAGESRLDANGNLYMILRAGYPGAPDDYGNGIINNTYGSKLLKISNTGVAQWMKSYNTGSNAQYGSGGIAILNVAGMQFTPDGNLYAIVEANNPAVAAPNAQFTYPHRIIKFNANGDEVWHTELYSTALLAAITVPKIFVDDAGNLTFNIYTTSNQWYFNGEAIAPQMGVYTSGPSTAYSMVISLNAEGSKKYTFADLGTNAFINFEGLNPLNGNLYLKYGVFAAKASTQTPFSTFPNQTLGLLSPSVYTFNATLVYNSAGQYVNYLLGNDVPVLSTIVRNGNNFATSLNLTPNVVYDKGDYVFNSPTDYSVVAFLDQDFNFTKALKTPKINLAAIYLDKLSISGECKTPLTLGTKTLTPNFNDTDFGTRFPFFASIKTDMFIAVADAAVIAPPVAATWLGVDNNWNNTANWSSGKVPDATTIVKFNANSAQMPTIATTPKALQVIIDGGINAELPQALTVANKIINNGKLTVSNATNGYIFTAFSAKEITGNGEIFFNGTTASSSVVINYLQSTFTKNLSFNQPIQVSGTFSTIKFIGTRATLTGDITIDNPNPNAITGFNNGAYFKGKLTRAVNATGTYNFPVGAPIGYDAEYAPATIQLNNLLGTKNITVSTEGLYKYTINEINLAANKVTVILQNTYLKTSVDVQPTSGSFAINVEKNTYKNGITDANRYVLINQNNKVWGFDGVSGTSTQTGGVLSGTVLSNGKVNTSLSNLTKFADAYAIGVANTAITPGLAVTTSTWTGTNNTIWANTANWSNGIPNGTVKAIIPAGLSNYPLIFTINDNAKSLTVNTGASIKLDLGLTLTNGLINNGEVEITDLRLNNFIKEFIVYNGNISGNGKLVFKTLQSVRGGAINNNVEVNLTTINGELNIIGKIGGNINIISGAVRAWDYGGQFLESTNPDATITVANPDFHIAGHILKSVKANGTYFLPLGDEQFHRLGIRKYGAITIKNNGLDTQAIYDVWFRSYFTEAVKIVDATTLYADFLNSGQWVIVPNVLSKTGTIDLILETKNYTNGRTNANDYVLLRRDVAVAKWIPVSGASITEAEGKVTVTANGLAPFTATTMFCIGLKAKTTQWTGTTNTDWNTASNWSNGIPNEDVKAQIIAGSPRYPVVAAGNNAALLEIGAGAIMKLPLAFDAKLGVVNNGTIEVIGTTQFRGFNSNQSPISGTGKLLFSNNSPADITAAYMTGQKINNGLEINKTGGVTTSYNMVVGGDLNLIDGLVKTSGALFMSNPDATITTTPSSYIVGTLNRKVNTNGTYNFPVGSATAYAPVNLTLNNIVGVQNINASFNPTANTTAPVINVGGRVIDKTLNNGVWTVTPDFGQTLTAGNYDVTLQTNNYTNGVTDASLYNIIKRSASYLPWEFLGNTPTATQTGGTITGNEVANGLINAAIKGLTGFSDFAIGIGQPGVLPIVLVNFKANKANEGVKLSWQTTAEKNSSHFEVQKSSDGINFNTIGRVEAAANSSENKYYSLTDYIPVKGINYYRLNKIDLDGKAVLSNPITINFDLGTDAKISVYPNPAINEVHFTGLKTGSSVTLFNLEGKTVLAQGISNNTLQIPTWVKSGYYVMYIKTNDGNTTILKVMVEGVK
ncbi:MAG: T9SS C-terminal target domain-containing protein [Sphingobacteriales bacterium]|nr:MAG: T9SS C-terminal target domain-containing protein [Sphingobacteriales bacterium]